MRKREERRVNETKTWDYNRLGDERIRENKREVKWEERKENREERRE